MVIAGKLTIIFADPFYKAVFEHLEGQKYAVAQVNLGTSLPKMPLILHLVNEKYAQLNFYQTSMKERIVYRKVNPKRAQRPAQKAAKRKTLGTKAQKALKQQFQARELAAKKTRLVQEKRFLLKQAKKCAKHRGH